MTGMVPEPAAMILASTELLILVFVILAVIVSVATHK